MTYIVAMRNVYGLTYRLATPATAGLPRGVGDLGDDLVSWKLASTLMTAQAIWVKPDAETKKAGTGIEVPSYFEDWSGRWLRFR